MAIQQSLSPTVLQISSRVSYETKQPDQCQLKLLDKTGYSYFDSPSSEKSVQHNLVSPNP